MVASQTYYAYREWVYVHERERVCVHVQVFVRMCVYTHASMDECVCVCACVCVCVCVCVCTRLHTIVHTCVCPCMRVCMCMCVCVWGRHAHVWLLEGGQSWYLCFLFYMCGCWRVAKAGIFVSYSTCVLVWGWPKLVSLFPIPHVWLLEGGQSWYLCFLFHMCRIDPPSPSPTSSSSLTSICMTILC